MPQQWSGTNTSAEQANNNDEGMDIAHEAPTAPTGPVHLVRDNRLVIFQPSMMRPPQPTPMRPTLAQLLGNLHIGNPQQPQLNLHDGVQQAPIEEVPPLDPIPEDAQLDLNLNFNQAQRDLLRQRAALRALERNRRRLQRDTHAQVLGTSMRTIQLLNANFHRRIRNDRRRLESDLQVNSPSRAISRALSRGYFNESLWCPQHQQQLHGLLHEVEHSCPNCFHDGSAQNQ